MKKELLIISLLVFILSSACKKGPGQGGESAIIGRVIQRDFDMDFKVLQNTYPATKEDVFIIYGSDKTYGDKTSTNYDGTFEFQYLLPGKYTVYVYSEDSTKSMAEKYAVIKEINIKKDGETQNIGTFIKYKSLQLNDGDAIITGAVLLTNYKNNFTEIKDISLAQEQDVYLMYEEHTPFDVRERTGYDGVYTFRNLIKGKYTVFVYSADHSGATKQIPVMKHIEITEDNQSATVDTLHIDKQ